MNKMEKIAEEIIKRIHSIHKENGVGKRRVGRKEIAERLGISEFQVRKVLEPNVVKRMANYYQAHKPEFRQYSQKWTAKNREGENKRKNRWYHEHKDWYNDWRKEYLKEKGEHYREYHKSWYAMNKSYILEQQRRYIGTLKGRKRHQESARQWFQKNKHQIYEMIKQQRKTDPQFLIKGRLYNSLWYALKQYTTTGKIQKAHEYGIDWKPIVEHLMATKPENTQGFDIDHIKPSALFDLTKPEEVRICFSSENLRWYPSSKNRAKGKKYPYQEEPERVKA